MSRLIQVNAGRPQSNNVTIELGSKGHADVNLNSQGERHA